MSGSRRRSYEPTGQLVPVSLVRVYTRDCLGEGKPYKVTVRIQGHGERTESFATKSARNLERDRLAGAVASGRDRFDVGSFRPTSDGAPVEATPALPQAKLLTFLAAHGQRMVVDDKPKSRASRLEAHLHTALALCGGEEPPAVEHRWAYLKAVLQPVMEAAHIGDPSERANLAAAVHATRIAALSAEARAAGVWLRRHEPFVTALTPTDAQAALDAFKLNPIRTGKAAATVRNRKRNVLHHALEAAVTQGLLPANPMDSLNLRGYSRSKLRVVDKDLVMSPPQVDVFIDEIGVNAHGVPDADAELRGYFSLMGREGLRCCEANAVQPEWLTPPTKPGDFALLKLRRGLVEAGSDNTDDGEVFSDQPLKWTDHDGEDDGKPRDVPVSPETWALLEPLWQQRKPGDLMFVTASGGPMTGYVRSRIVKKARTRMFANDDSPNYQPDPKHPLRTMPPGALRHAAASAMLNSGMSVKVAARRLGHDESVLLRIYASVMSGDDERANAQLVTYRQRMRAEAAGEAEAPCQCRAATAPAM